MQYVYAAYREKLLKMSFENSYGFVIKYQHNEWQKLRKSSCCHYFFDIESEGKRDEKGTGGMYMSDIAFLPEG